jgi:hypothetical protein
MDATIYRLFEHEMVTISGNRFWQSEDQMPTCAQRCLGNGHGNCWLLNVGWFSRPRRLLSDTQMDGIERAAGSATTSSLPRAWVGVGGWDLEVWILFGLWLRYAGPIFYNLIFLK